MGVSSSLPSGPVLGLETTPLVHSGSAGGASTPRVTSTTVREGRAGISPSPVGGHVGRWDGLPLRGPDEDLKEGAAQSLASEWLNRRRSSRSKKKNRRRLYDYRPSTSKWSSYYTGRPRRLPPTRPHSR